MDMKSCDTLAALVHPIVPRSEPSAELCSILLFFDSVYLLPDCYSERAVSRAWGHFAKALLESEREIPLEEKRHEGGWSLDLPAEKLLPYARVAARRLMYVGDIERYASQVKPLLAEGLVKPIPIDTDAVNRFELVFRRVDGDRIRALFSEKLPDVSSIFPGTPDLFALSELPWLEDLFREINRPDVPPNRADSFAFVLGLITHLYVARFALANHLTLVTDSSASYAAMKSVVECFDEVAWPKVWPDEKQEGTEALLRLFSETISYLVPALTPRSYESILYIRQAINREGELDEFRDFLRTAVIRDRIQSGSPTTIQRFVKGVIAPEVRKIEKAISGRWKTLATHVYEESVQNMPQRAVEYCGSLLLFGEPLLSLLLAGALGVWKAERATQKSIASSSELYSELQYLVRLRAQASK